MNYLSHQHLAGLVVPAGAPPEFFAGNVLPDLLALAGDGRLRAEAVAGAPGDDPLARGVRLHHAADHWFHSHPAFKAATADASARLRAAPFEEAPRRLFFVAHVFVELALDAAVLRAAPGIADDLYRALAAVPPGYLARRVAEWRGAPPDGPRLRLAEFLPGFIASGYLRDYARPEGLALALSRIGWRVGLENFRLAEDRDRLARTFAAYESAAGRLRDTLFAPGAFAPSSPW